MATNPSLFGQALAPLVEAPAATLRDEHQNFYFLQEDLLRSLAAQHGFSWTIFRPQVVYGESSASPTNIGPVLGVYAALAWAATAPAARDETFNLTNGDVFDWHEVWPMIAETLGMEVGAPRPVLPAETMPALAEAWAALVDRHDLLAPRELDEFVGRACSPASRSGACCPCRADTTTGTVGA